MTLDLDEFDIFGTEGSGHQKKCWITINGEKYLIKLNSKYREASKEVSASTIAIASGVNAVRYEEGKYKYRGRVHTGCICKSFAGTEDEAHPVHWLINDIAIPKGLPAREYFNILAGVMGRLPGLSVGYCKEYLMHIVTLDYLMCNPDRHLSNIEVVHNAASNTYRLPPIFDFGQSFFKRDGAPTAAELNHLMIAFKTLPFSRKPETNLIDIRYAQHLCGVYIENINKTYGDIDRLPIKEFHKQVFKARVRELLSLDDKGHHSRAT